MKRTEFCVRQVVYHLCSAEMWQELFEVVSDVEWLLARAQLEPLGLVLDLEHAAAAAAAAAAKQLSEFLAPLSTWNHSSSDSTQHLPLLPRTVKLMAQALRMDLDELRYDYRSVASVLVGRLVAYEPAEAAVRGLLVKLREWEGPMPQGWSKQTKTNKQTKNSTLEHSLSVFGLHKS